MKKTDAAARLSRLCAGILLVILAFSPAAFAVDADAEGKSEINIIYKEDFSSAEGLSGSDLMTALGWEILSKDAKTAVRNNTAKYSVTDGRLYVNNNEGVNGGDSYVRILGDEIMRPYAAGDYTVQYDLTLISCADNARYIAVLHEYRESTKGDYLSFHLRANGSGNNQARVAGNWTNFDVEGSNYYAPDQDDSDGTSTIVQKICGKKYNGGGLLLGVDLTIRLKCAASAPGPEVWIRNNSAGGDFIKVSEPAAEAGAAQYWRSDSLPQYNIVLKPGGAVDGFVDNILVFAGVGEPVFTDAPETEEQNPEQSGGADPDDPGAPREKKRLAALWEDRRTGKTVGWIFLGLIGILAAFFAVWKKNEK